MESKFTMTLLECITSCLRNETGIINFVKSSNLYISRLIQIVKTSGQNKEIVQSTLRLLRQILVPQRIDVNKHDSILDIIKGQIPKPQLKAFLFSIMLDFQNEIPVFTEALISLAILHSVDFNAIKSKQSLYETLFSMRYHHEYQKANFIIDTIQCEHPFHCADLKEFSKKLFAVMTNFSDLIQSNIHYRMHANIQ